MKLQTRNTSGTTKILMPLLAIVAIGAGGSYLLAASHADSFPPFVSFGSSEGTRYFAPGKLTLAADNHKLAFRQDGNLVLSDRSTGNTLWSSNTNGRVNAGGFLALQSSGRIAIYATHNAPKPIWSSPYQVNNPSKDTVFTLSASGLGGHADETQSYNNSKGTTTVPFWTMY